MTFCAIAAFAGAQYQAAVFDFVSFLRSSSDGFR